MAKRRRTPLPELWGPAEIMEQLDVSKATLTRWRKRDDFPVVEQELHMGPLWRADDVREWASSPTRDRRRRAA